jgi:FMN reductase
MARILAVSGSPSPVSRTTAVLDLVSQQLSREGHDVDVLYLRALPAYPLLHADMSDPYIANARDRLAQADAVVLATPVYKASFSGLLKVWFDSVAQLALTGKTVLPLATGGSLTSVLALDYALRPVLSAMGAAHVVPGYFVLDKLVVQSSENGWSIERDARDALDLIIEGFLRAITVKGFVVVTARAAS